MVKGVFVPIFTDFATTYACEAAFSCLSRLVKVLLSNNLELFSTSNSCQLHKKFGITVVTQCNVVDYMSVMTNLIEN